MKQTASGWVILTRKLVAGFHPQNDNHRVRFVIQSDPPPNDSRIGAEASLPQLMRDYHDLVVMTKQVVVRPEAATQQRCNTKNAQKARRDLPAVQKLRLSIAGQVHRRPGHDGQGFEAFALLFPISEDATGYGGFPAS